ncbi:MAG: protein kinase, partial [Candidatus Woesearchaeota archaeon]
MGIDNSNQTNPIKKKAIFKDQPADIIILKKDFEKDGYLFGNPLGTGSETRHGVYHVIKCLMKDGKIVKDGNNNPVVIQEFAAKVFREETIKAILSTEVENWKKIPAHKSIVTLRDIQTRKGYTVLFMDFFKGENLDDYVHDPKNQNNKGLSYGHYSTILDEALQGIHHAHQHNVIHRDITPHNIMVGSEVNSDGIAPVKIIDFGIAKIRNQAPTQTIGSPGYRAPESHSKVGAQVTMDVFSIGVLANELFSCVYKEGIQGIADLIADKRQNDKEILPAELEQIVKSNVTSVNTIKDNKGNEVKDEWGNPKKVRPYQLSGMSFDQAGNIA